MSRSLEEILNTPIEFKEGMRVFSIIDNSWALVGFDNDATKYPLRAKLLNGGITWYTEEGYFSFEGKIRTLLTEQEAYELFPSLKPKVYEYQVLTKMHGQITYNLSLDFYASIDGFLEEAREVSSHYSTLELYQPSKRERKS